MENHGKPSSQSTFFPIVFSSFVLSSIDFPALSTAVSPRQPSCPAQPWKPSAPRKALYPEVSHRQVRLLTAAHFFTIVPLHEVRGRMARYLRAAHSMLHVEGLL